MATCSKCLKNEEPDDIDEMLLCDGCDLAMHVSCAGLSEVPDGDWLCGSCLDILDTRKKSLATDGKADIRTLVATLPPLPELDVETALMGTNATKRFHEEMISRRKAAVCRLEENQGVLAVASKARVTELRKEVQEADVVMSSEEEKYNSARSRTMDKHGLMGWSLHGYRSHIKCRLDDGSVVTLHRERIYVGGRIQEVKGPDWDR